MYMASMTLRLFRAWKRNIVSAKTMDMMMCTFSLVRLAFSVSFISSMSTQNDVVIDVRAESALLNAAAIIPMVKNMRIDPPSMPDVQNMGSMSSPDAGSAMPVCDASVMSITPRQRKRKFIGANASP